jgi:hypothetical protein
MQIIMVEEDATKKQVQGDGVQTPRQANDLHPVCANAEVMVLPQYNKPKKTKDAQILKEGESSTIGI